MRALITEIGEEKQFNQLFFLKKKKNIATLLMPRVRAKENTGGNLFFPHYELCSFWQFQGITSNKFNWMTLGGVSVTQQQKIAFIKVSKTCMEWHE